MYLLSKRVIFRCHVGFLEGTPPKPQTCNKPLEDEANMVPSKHVPGSRGPSLTWLVPILKADFLGVLKEQTYPHSTS